MCLLLGRENVDFVLNDCKESLKVPIVVIHLLWKVSSLVEGSCLQNLHSVRA